MSQAFQKIIKPEHFPVHPSDIKFKTYFQNCIPAALTARKYKKTDDEDWDIYWCQKHLINDTLDKIRLHPQKKVNHFRNFYQLCRKDLLSKNIKRYKKQLEKEGKKEEAIGYNFAPLTYNLPSEYPIFAEQFKRTRQRQKATWIMKPIGSSQGKGIFLFRALGEIEEWSAMSNQPELYIVQRYIDNPLLIGQKKFDLRIYVLVTCYNPLTVYLYRSGFARFTHVKYDASDIDSREGHLSNVAVQKHSKYYDEEKGGKYQIDKLRLYLVSKFGEQKIVNCFMDVEDLVVRTLFSVAKSISMDKRCFQLYGFDILLDLNLRPWLIEVNGSPSMTHNTPVDKKLKTGLLDDTLTILNFEKVLTGDEDQVGGFDLICKQKRIKNKGKFSYLGCFNNRQSQLLKLAKSSAFRLAEQAKKRQEQKKNVNNRKNLPSQQPKGNDFRTRAAQSIKLPKVPNLTTSHSVSRENTKEPGSTNNIFTVKKQNSVGVGSTSFKVNNISRSGKR